MVDEIVELKNGWYSLSEMPDPSATFNEMALGMHPFDAVAVPPLLKVDGSVTLK